MTNKKIKIRTFKSKKNTNISIKTNTAESTEGIPENNIFPIVGTASSAGGIAVLKTFFTHVPFNSGLSFVVNQHLEPTYDSRLVESIQSITAIKVFQAKNQLKVSPNCIYVIPPCSDIEIIDGLLYLVKRQLPCQQHLPADHFFQSLADEQNEFAIGVVFSGMGADGTAGLQAIKNKNGLTFAQEPSSCKFDSMPSSAISAGVVDVVGLVEELPGMIIAKLKHRQVVKSDENIFIKNKRQSSLNKITHLLAERTGHDFSQYKKSTLYRRIARREKVCKVANIDAYILYLHKDNNEIDLLFREILIHVTHFFRDPEVWKHLEEVALPSLLSEHVTPTTLRVWVPACSTGEEAYSLAILFMEALNNMTLKDKFKLKIFATDLDQDALKKARKGTYPLGIDEYVSSERLSRFFDKNKHGYQVKNEIREQIVFAEHNMVADAPFSKLDMVSCRNLLIYFNRKLQENLLPLLHYGLNPGGLLLLGTAETIGRFNDLFIPINVKLPIYKAVYETPQQTSLNFPSANHKKIKLYPFSYKSDLNKCHLPPLLINPKGNIVYSTSGFNTQLESYKNISQSDQADSLTIDTLITELQITREEVHAAHEEMQTSHEELRSSNEELRATNDDLHHANDKLQKTNDDLTGSKLTLIFTNDQLQLINTKLTAYIQAIGKLALVSVTDRAGIITEANKTFCKISKYSENELIGQNHRILNSGVHPKSFFEEMWATIVSGHIWHKEICNKSKDGGLYWVDSTIIPFKDNDGIISSYISIRVDISARKRKELQLTERLKERSCLYAIHRDMVQELSLDKLCKKIIKHLTLAMQFPELAACRIELYREYYVSDNYHDDLSQSISAKIKINGTVYGQVNVFYTEDKPFLLPDEQNLINFIAVDLSRWCERKNHEQNISHMASHDVLTGLPNRALLQDRITQAIEFNQRHHGMAAVLFIDLDNFKNINDTFGHDVGDLLLKKVGARLLSSIRSGDTVARQGGDEFIVILPYIKETSVVEMVAQKILDMLSKPYQVNVHEFHVTCSIGVALYPEHGRDACTLLKHSDTAMYHAKTLGRNICHFFTEEMSHDAMENHRLINQLRCSLKTNELSLHFQPIVDNNNNLTSLEALLRWQNTEQGMIPPSRFIPLAEESGLILPLGDWVIRSVCLQINAWENKGYEKPRVAINLSAKQLQQKNFVKSIQNILNETGIAAQNLILEITESLLMKDTLDVTNTLHQLSEMGFTIAIDDFGTGYSSLSYLKHYPVDKLKIDRSFVQDIIQDDNDLAIVAATIAMAHSLGIKVIAEGVETKDQLSLLVEKGCDLYQGYYFGKPSPAVKTECLLKRKVT